MSTETADTTARSGLPGKPVPYVLLAGEGHANLLLGEVGRTLAGAEETNDGLSVMTLSGPAAPRPIPLHRHELEHDVFLCVRGRIQVWFDGESRVLTPGDLASVPPGVLHAYQLLDHDSQFMGPLHPAGWDRFFDFVGTPYEGPAYPAVDDSPPPFAKFGAAQGKFRMSYDQEAPYAEATTGADDALPDGFDAFVLRKGEGPRHTAFGQVCFQLLTAAQSGGNLGMAVVEGPAGSAVPAHVHATTPEAIYCLDGLMRIRLDGEDHVLTRGDFVNVPAGTEHAITFERNGTSYATLTAPAGLERFHELAGEPAAQRIFAPAPVAPDPAGLERAAAELDVTFT
jgi:quercetin 2,3-dioxygenase